MKLIPIKFLMSIWFTAVFIGYLNSEMKKRSLPDNFVFKQIPEDTGVNFNMVEIQLYQAIRSTSLNKDYSQLTENLKSKKEKKKREHKFIEVPTEAIVPEEIEAPKFKDTIKHKIRFRRVFEETNVQNTQ
jgi:hypothetical protein